MAELPPNSLVHRYAKIACPSGKHDTSVVTFKDHSVAVMFCIPCEEFWTVPSTHPEMKRIARDNPMRA